MVEKKIKQIEDKKVMEQEKRLQKQKHLEE
jgi:hypothetical protein